MEEEPTVTTMEPQDGYRFLVHLDQAERKGEARVQVKGMRTTVESRMARNEAGRLRIGGVALRIALDVAPDDRPRRGRCMRLFEDFCAVTQSVRGGIFVDVAPEIPERQ
jgi:hypothetical protein